MSNVNSKVFSHTHYGLSTVAAVLYGIAWLMGTRVHAEAVNEPTVLPAVIVTAQRAVPAVLDPIVVVAQRPQTERYATLDPVVVTAKRDNASAQSAILIGTLPVASTAKPKAQRKTVVAQVRNWVAASLLK